MSKYALGIDLGTTFSSVSILLNGTVNVIQDKLHSPYVPSVVYYSIKKKDIQIAVEGFAKRKSILSPKNAIYDTKRMLAKEYYDENIQKLITKWPFKIERSKTGKILICLDGTDTKLEPYEVSSEILKYLCEVGNSRLPPDKKTQDVVITIPANFGNDQRSETIRAAEKANLNVLKIINEPTSAGIACKLLTDYKNIHNIFVFDFGGNIFWNHICDFQKISNFQMTKEITYMIPTLKI